MSARLSWVGPREPRAGGPGEEVSPGSVIRQAWAASWITQAALAGAAGAAIVHAGFDGWQHLRDTYAVVVVDGQVQVVKEWRR